MLSTYLGVIADQELDAIKLLNHEHVSDRFKEDYINFFPTLHTICTMFYIAKSNFSYGKFFKMGFYSVGCFTTAVSANGG